MRITPLHLLAISLLMLGTARAGLEIYNDSYAGDVTVKTGKKEGTMAAGLLAVSSMTGDSAVFNLGASGQRGIRAKVDIALNPDGTASLLVDCKVLANPKFIAKKGGNAKAKGGGKGKKVRVKYTAKGSYALAEDGVTVYLDVSNNRGRRGNNVSGYITKDVDGNLILWLNSGFKEKLKGVGKRMSISFLGAPLDV